MVATFTLPTQETAFSSGRWTEVHAKSDKGPSSRYGHSSVIHDQKVKHNSFNLSTDNM